MLPGYRHGDIVAVARCAYGLRLPLGLPGGSRYLLHFASPKVGDVVAASSPSDGGAIVKRIAAVGPVLLRVEGGRLVGGPLDLELHPAEGGRPRHGFHRARGGRLSSGR